MAIRADDLAARDLGFDPPERVSLVYKERYLGCLVSHVIELQDHRVCQAAVGTAGCGKQPQHVASRLRPSSLARCAHLLNVQLSAFADVLGPALPARALPLVELSHRQVRSAGSAASRLDGISRRRRSRRRRARRDDRHSLRAEAQRLSLRRDLPTCHANICSRRPRTL
jgi:hypothetical protein